MMNETLLGAVLLLLLGLGILVVVTDRLFTAVVYSAALSACIAFGYLLLGAPDVALAEAIIGSALTTVIYLATLKKYRIFTIRCLPGDTRKDPLFSKVLEVISRSLKDHDLEAHLIESRGNARTLLERPDTDLVAEKRKDGIYLYGEADSQYLGRIREQLIKAGLDGEARIVDTAPTRIAAYKGKSI